MSDENLQYAHAEIYKFLGETMQENVSNYWALICWNRKYCTLFHDNPKASDEELSDIIMEIIESLGEVKDITNNEKGAVEIWITDETSTECYLLFNYNSGVVEGIA